MEGQALLINCLANTVFITLIDLTSRSSSNSSSTAQGVSDDSDLKGLFPGFCSQIAISFLIEGYKTGLCGLSSRCLTPGDKLDLGAWSHQSS